MIDISGRRFGDLTAVRPTGKHSGARNLIWLFTCICGNDREADSYTVRSRKITSCRACGKKRGNDASLVHGQSHSPTYRIWSGMLNRCYNENNHSFKNYGQRGITVCARWRVFANFLADMGTRPEGRSLDRIDNNGNYEPGNCHWATQIEQGNNTRANRHVQVAGEKLTLAQCARRFGVTPMTIRYRSVRGSDLTSPALKDSTAKIYEHSGQSMRLSEWSKKIGIRKGLLALRLSRGWTFSRTIETPLQRKRG